MLRTLAFLLGAATTVRACPDRRPDESGVLQVRIHWGTPWECRIVGQE